MSRFQLTEDQIASYHRDGYLIVREFFNKEEVSKLHSVATEDDAMKNNSIDLNDQSGDNYKYDATGNLVYDASEEIDTITWTVYGKIKKIIPAKIDEKKARLLQNTIHSVQSDYDTYVKNTLLEQTYPKLKILRGYVSLPLHLLEALVWLSIEMAGVVRSATRRAISLSTTENHSRLSRPEQMPMLWTIC